MTMDLRKLKKLIDLVQESGIGELEITEGEEKVRISRNSSGGAQFMMVPQGMAQAPQAMSTGPSGGSLDSAAAAPEPAGHSLKSPMVGTFYRASEPGAKPDLLVETHLFDFDGDLYGQKMEVLFIEKLRDERRFPDVQALVDQIRKDETRAREILRAQGFLGS